MALSLPICALVAVLCMGARGISANLMSLGGIAIAIGMLGDGAIVMVENLFRHLGERHGRGESKATVIYDAAREVNRPIVFSIAIIIIVFLPLFTLEGVEGKMFSPMAFTIAFALLGSLLVAVLVAPVLSLFLLKQAPHKELALVRVLKAVYRPLLARRCPLQVRRRGCWPLPAFAREPGAGAAAGNGVHPHAGGRLDPDRRHHGAVHLAGGRHEAGHGDGEGRSCSSMRSTKPSRASAGPRRAAIRTRSTTPRSTSS